MTSMFYVSDEQAVLGAMFVDWDYARQTLEKLDSGHFKVPAHTLVFSAMRELHLAGEPIDLITMRDKLTAWAALETIGGYDYLIELASSFVGGNVMFEHYLTRLAEC